MGPNIICYIILCTVQCFYKACFPLWRPLRLDTDQYFLSKLGMKQYRGHSIATWTIKVDRYYSKDAFLTTSRENRTGKSFSPIIWAMDDKFYSLRLRDITHINGDAWRNCLRKSQRNVSRNCPLNCRAAKLLTKLSRFTIIIVNEKMNVL